MDLKYAVLEFVGLPLIDGLVGSFMRRGTFGDVAILSLYTHFSLFLGRELNSGFVRVCFLSFREEEEGERKRN